MSIFSGKIEESLLGRNEMKIRLALLLAVVLIIGGCSPKIIYVSPPSSEPTPTPEFSPTPTPTLTPTPAPPTPVKHEEVIASLHDTTLSGGNFWHPSAHLQAGTEVTISWEADGPVSAWILTETQYDDFVVMAQSSRYIGYKRGSSGTLTRELPYKDTYFFIISNSILLTNYKVYSAEVKAVTWSDA